ncbi:MAG: hypothetical protein KF851_12965 [Pirellulaceae bacterium]|nr:hypothetical protein [Pirellulaceae bacterium]
MNIFFRPANAIFVMSVALAFAMNSTTHADTYVETFDGPLNPIIWNLNAAGNDWVVSDGKLKITRTNANNAHMTFVPQLIGDFDVQFDYELFWAGFPGADRIQLGVFTDAPTYAYVVGHTQEFGGNIHGVAVDPFARYGWGPSVLVGKMRVTRTGSDILMQYSNGGGWITLQTGTDSRDMWVGIDNYIFNSFGAGSRVEIDNFSISADLFSTSIPEPGSVGIVAISSLMAGLFGSRRRRIGSV